jgi:hypothetical protein
MEKIKSFLRRLFLDPHPELSETHSATREAMMCPPYPCPGASPALCATCREERKPLAVNHA